MSARHGTMARRHTACRNDAGGPRGAPQTSARAAPRGRRDSAGSERDITTQCTLNTSSVLARSRGARRGNTRLTTRLAPPEQCSSPNEAARPRGARSRVRKHPTKVRSNALARAKMGARARLATVHSGATQWSQISRRHEPPRHRAAKDRVRVGARGRRRAERCTIDCSAARRYVTSVPYGLQSPCTAPPVGQRAVLPQPPTVKHLRGHADDAAHQTADRGAGGCARA